MSINSLKIISLKLMETERDIRFVCNSFAGEVILVNMVHGLSRYSRRVRVVSGAGVRKLFTQTVQACTYLLHVFNPGTSPAVNSEY